MSAKITTEQANLFHFDGDGLRVTYSSTSFSGDPLFSYQDSHRHLEFKGDQIKIERTAIGQLVSVVLLAIADGNSTSFTLVVPDTLLRNGTPLGITTFGVTTLHRSTLIGPPPGQNELYTTHTLRGTAEFIVP